MEENCHVKYFRITPKQKLLNTYNLIYTRLNLDHWLDKAKSVIDLGCGKYGGMFNIKKFPTMIGIDPLWDAYGRNYCCPGVRQIIGKCNVFNCTDVVDAIIILNALNYFLLFQGFPDEILSHLQIGGVLIVYDILRDANQLGHGNKRIINKQIILKCFDKMKHEYGHTFRRDYYVGKYKAFAGVWRKV